MTDHVDVLIIGAGLSGVGAAVHLERDCPGRTYAILEARDAIGGTWDLFRYPGIRSDSDMYTLGYRFKPWTAAKAIADGPSILSYVRETAAEYGVERHVRFGHRVVRAAWSTPESRWTVDVERADTGETIQLTCDFMVGCTGYYRYDEGYTPEFAGTDTFTGRIVHPQHWPEDLDYTAKKVVVIGSGATAVTLVPAMAKRAAHVTMLQRSPTYVISLPGEDPLARALRRVLPERAAYTAIRWKNVLLTMFSFQLSRRRPEVMKHYLRKGVARELPKGYDIDRHFTPTYNPWDQRLCLVPDGDLFDVLRDGSASIVTDHIDTFTPTGIRLRSGQELEADIIITATGLNLVAMGGMQLSVDGEDVDLSERMGYKGMMLGGVPNCVFTFGYTNASWTLKADLTAEFTCRLLNHMAAHGYTRATPRPDPSVKPLPFVDFSSGYVQRAIAHFPKQGDRAPWRLHQNYARDLVLLRHRPIEDEALEFAGPVSAEAPQPVAV